MILERPDETNVPYYSLSILICCLACIIELCGEAANAVGQICFLAKQKVLIEAASLLIFHITFVVIAIFIPGLGALAYGIARLVYSILYVLLNFYFLLKKHRTEISEKLNFNVTLSILLPEKFIFLDNLDYQYFNLVKLYYIQSIYKQILTEGERYLITAFNLLTFSDSGIYDIINNLGSLIARFVFLPVEDASYIYFTNSLSRGVDYKRHVEDRPLKKDEDLTPKTSFENLLKLVSLIGMLVLFFGQGYSQLLLQIYGGDRLGKFFN